jgi:hypothetical protein
MVPTRLCAVLLLVANLAIAKSPADSSTVCDRFQRSDLIFTGTAETAWITMVDTRKSPVHRRSEKSKRVRFLVREWFKGQRRTTVEVWITPSECPLSIEADQTYLIYARINKDDERIESNACMGTVLVSSAASDLTYLAAAQLGPAQATHLTGTASGPGANIQAKSAVETRYAVADGAGQFVFDGLRAGDWELMVLGGPSKPVHLEPNSCIDVSFK